MLTSLQLLNVQLALAVSAGRVEVEFYEFYEMVSLGLTIIMGREPWYGTCGMISFSQYRLILTL